MKAPQQVDTLRDESCPVCSEADAWDGDECRVCGFVAPPDKFQDPDVDLHKQLDLRNNSDLDGGDVADLNADTNDRDGDGLDDHTGEPIHAEDEAGADDAQPMLACPNCGYEVEAAEPQSVDTAEGDPELRAMDGQQEDEALDQQAATGEAAAGDLCPNCGKAPLMSPDELAEATGAPSGDDPDPDAAPEQDDPEMEDRGSPFPSKDDDSDDADDSGDKDGDDDPPDSDDDRDQDSDDDTDDDSDDSDKPAGKKFPPGKK